MPAPGAHCLCSKCTHSGKGEWTRLTEGTNAPPLHDSSATGIYEVPGLSLELHEYAGAHRSLLRHREGPSLVKGIIPFKLR